MIIYAGITIFCIVGAVFIGNKLLGSIGGGASSATATGATNLGTAILQTIIVATGVAGGAVSGHVISTEILGVKPPPIIEEYLGSPWLSNKDCSWGNNINGKWDIVDTSSTFNVESGKRVDLPFLVGGLMSFNKNHTFQLKSETLSFDGRWTCIQDDLLRLDIQLDVASIKKQLGSELDLPDKLPADIGIIAIYSITYNKFDIDEIYSRTYPDFLVFETAPRYGIFR